MSKTVKNSTQVRNGQIWKFLNKTEYLVSEVDQEEQTSKIQAVDTLSEERISAAPYRLDNFDLEENQWVLISDPEKECPECNEQKIIPEGDFLCSVCRGKQMTTGRLIAEVHGELLIVNFEGNNEEISFDGPEVIKQQQPLLRIQRSDLSIPVLEALREFVK